MDFSQSETEAGVWVDSRRALFCEREGILAIADLHLGYSWAHRHAGQLLPLHPVDQWADRLQSLCDTYQPRKIIMLGDVVHRALPIAPLQEEFGVLAARFGTKAEVLILLGNHDRDLRELSLPESFGIERSFRSGRMLFCHGDASVEGEGAELSIIGHEHPAIALGDGVSTSARFPCFLVSREVIVLPAFSLWASGTTFGSYPLMSPLARRAHFEKAIAIMGARLLTIPI